MGFTNIGNFGKKISEFNAQRREKNMEKLRTKAQNAETENARLQEEMQLRKSIEMNNQLKKQVNEQKMAKVKGVLEGFNKLGEKFENNSKENKFDILGNNNSNVIINKHGQKFRKLPGKNNYELIQENKTPELFGKPGNNKFKL